MSCGPSTTMLLGPATRMCACTTTLLTSRLQPYVTLECPLCARCAACGLHTGLALPGSGLYQGDGHPGGRVERNLLAFMRMPWHKCVGCAMVWCYGAQGRAMMLLGRQVPGCIVHRFMYRSATATAPWHQRLRTVSLLPADVCMYCVATVQVSTHDNLIPATMQFELADKLRARTVTIPTGTSRLRYSAPVTLLRQFSAIKALLSQCHLQSEHQTFGGCHLAAAGIAPRTETHSTAARLADNIAHTIAGVTRLTGGLSC